MKSRFPNSFTGLVAILLTSFILTGNLAAEGEVEFKKNISQIKGLLVVQLQGERYAGTASALTAAALPSNDTSGTLVKFNQPVGPLMDTALGEVIKFHQLRHSGWPDKRVLELSFAEKYSPKDGPSAAVACALLMESLITGIDIDSGFAVTGDMNVDGSVQPIGGVQAKVRGATKKDCNVIGIPVKNQTSVYDLVLLEGLNPILGIQIFTIENFGEALAVARADRTAATKSAVEEFALVQDVFTRPGADTRALLAHPEVQKKLRLILENCPNHLSAKVMLQGATGTFPPKLSIGGSLTVIDRAYADLGPVIEAGVSKTGSSRLNDDALEVINELRLKRTMIDNRVLDYFDAMVDFGTKVRNWKNARNAQPTQLRDLAKSAMAAEEKLAEEIKKIQADSSVMEELLE